MTMGQSTICTRNYNANDLKQRASTTTKAVTEVEDQKPQVTAFDT